MKTKLNKKITAAIFTFLITIAVFSPFPKTAQAVDCWFIPCDGIFDQAMDMLKSALLAILKEEGANLISKGIDDAAGEQYIEDWTKHLTTDPEKKAKDSFEKYLDQTIAQGKGTSSYVTKEQFVSLNNSDFEGVGPDSFKIGLYRNDSMLGNFVESVSAASSSSSSSSSSNSNYLKDLVNKAKDATTKKVEPAVTYVGDPKKMFEDGTFKNLNTYASGINNPWSFTTNAQVAYDKKLTETKKQAETIAVAGQGWIGNMTSDGKVKMPGSTASAIYAQSKDVGNKVLAGAQDIPTAMISMICSMASQALTDGISGGSNSEDSSSDNSAKKNDLQSQMNQLSSDSQENDMMSDIEIEDVLLPSILRTLFGD